MRLLILTLFLSITTQAQFSTAELSRYKTQAQNVTVYEDNWGIPHIYGKTDADAVFGLMYIQCSQNFKRVERNYLEVMGRLSESEGPQWLIDDLQMQMIYDTAAAKKDYEQSPAWLKKLCNAFADGINYYLATHPQTKPAVLQRFEPWFPLMYTDGSISATQMAELTAEDTKRLYLSNSTAVARTKEVTKPTGSNGFAIAPGRSASGKAMLYINPHVTFYFRNEVHMSSAEGLNVYGAATWGNFFIYQGFNESCGWMHTSSYADVADLYAEKVQQQNGQWQYEYDGKQLPVRAKQIQIPVRDSTGNKTTTSLTVYYTHHGPVMGERDGKWLSLKERNRSLTALQQSWLRTKATSFAQFKQVMELRSNNSNNTVYADREGNIAYWHGNFMPIRDTTYNWQAPVDGSTSKTEWKGLHLVAQTVHLINPKSGWIQNCNSTPFTSSGASSPNSKKYPTYMAPDGENGRGVTAARLLNNAPKLSLDGLINLGYNKYLSSFDLLLPPLFTAFDALPQNDVRKKDWSSYMRQLRNWSRHSAASSVPTTWAIEWATKLNRQLPPPQTDIEGSKVWERHQQLAKEVPAEKLLELFGEVMQELQQRWGTVYIPWGDVNRFQRHAQSLNMFDDAAPSLPVGSASAQFGSLPSYSSLYFPNTKKRYGVHGNSFVAAVEFGPRVKAKTVLAGGNSFHPSSPNFTDQAERYIEGNFKEILFYKEDVIKAAVRTYRPGEEK